MNQETEYFDIHSYGESVLVGQQSEKKGNQYSHKISLDTALSVCTDLLDNLTLDQLTQKHSLSERTVYKILNGDFYYYQTLYLRKQFTVYPTATGQKRFFKRELKEVSRT